MGEKKKEKKDKEKKKEEKEKATVRSAPDGSDNHKCSLIQILDHVHIHWTTALIGMFCLPGSIPALHPQRTLDPDQPSLHHAHPLPGSNLWTSSGIEFKSSSEN